MTPILSGVSFGSVDFFVCVGVADTGAVSVVGCGLFGGCAHKR